MKTLTDEKLTIVGAAGMIGSNMAQTAIMMGLSSNICLYDPYAPGLEGVAEELFHCGFEGVNITFTSDIKEALTGAKYIVNSGGAFSRNPANGDNKFYGEWLINAQGEDVVAGIRTPNPLNEATKTEKNKDLQSLEKAMPEVYAELDGIRTRLEEHFHDMQDIEFTIQEGHLWMLQCRIGKRTGLAALQMAIDMLEEGMID